MPRAVLDTNVLISALISPGGPSAKLLLELRAGAFELVVSPTLLSELRDVLSRPKFEQYVSPSDIDAYVQLISRESIVIEDPVPSREPLGVDPSDQFLIDLARSARTDALVTGDAHLLNLRGKLPVMSPRQFLEWLALI